LFIRSPVSSSIFVLNASLIRRLSGATFVSKSASIVERFGSTVILGSRGVHFDDSRGIFDRVRIRIRRRRVVDWGLIIGFGVLHRVVVDRSAT